MLGGCQRFRASPQRVAAAALAPDESFAELRTVKGALTVAAPGEAARAPYPRERLVEGEHISVPADGLAWMRRDGGATWLIAGPAELDLRALQVELKSGRAFIDTEQTEPIRVVTPKGELELADARASVEVEANEASAYVLRGSVRAGDNARANSGEMLHLLDQNQVQKSSVVSWQDWTGGLGTADAAAAPAPFGIGTVGARPPGAKGQPRFSLVVQRLDVKVSIDHDFALTEVDQTFVNPSSDTVEGLFSFRTPNGAVLQAFGVDRDGEIVWGRVKESAQAVQQYESNVYAGSTEDPALLQWQGAGVYSARLYPIGPGARRRVVTRYAEWLPRTGSAAERRLYVYPMAAEGARGTLPRIEELNVTFDLGMAAAKRVRAGMGAKREGERVIVKAFDFTPRADLALELFDDGQASVSVYRAPHNLLPQEAPESKGQDFAKAVSKEEVDYLAIPLRAPAPAANGSPGLDLAIVVDTSAATEPSALAIARTLAESLLAHLGPNDRAALWSGDAVLRPVAAGAGKLAALDTAKKSEWLSGLSAVERGGATDMGALLSEAAAALDPARQGAVVYIGDGAPSVGELVPQALMQRLERLPKSTRVFAAAVGSQPNLALLESVARGAPVEQVYDAYGAARAALRLLESAARPVWLDAQLDLGPGIERVLPHVLPPISADQSLTVVGRVVGPLPTTLKLTGSGGSFEAPITLRRLDDHGDLRRRWGEGRLWELMNTGAGRASLVDIGQRFGLVSPVTSLYVPTRREAATQEQEDPELAYQEAEKRKLRWKPWSGGGMLLGARKDYSLAPAEDNADNKEGGTGTRAKGEEGSMGARYAVQGPPGAAAPAPPPGPPLDQAVQRAEALAEDLKSAQNFGAIGLLNQAAGGEPEAERAKSDERPRPTAGAAVKPAAPGDPLAGLDEPLSGTGQGGGGVGEGIGLGGIGTIGHGAGSGTGQGFGAGHGRLGGSHATSAPKVRMGKVSVNGNLPREVVQRIVRQNYGRFRLCYEQALQSDPNAGGTIELRFRIDSEGAIGSIKPSRVTGLNAAMIACTERGFESLSFPMPEGGSVAVLYAITFGETAPESSATAVVEGVAGVGHVRAPCGAAADLPLAERQILWRERLASNTTAQASLQVYRSALVNCEAIDWRERAALLISMVDNLPSVADRVELWRLFLNMSPVAADVVYRSMLLRVQSSADLKALHDALGLERIEPEMLDKLLDQAKDAADRLARLRGVAEKFPDDTELALLVLDAYEDIGDDGGGRAWARKLRRRTDATAHVRTNVGEYYLRLAHNETGDAAARDTDEARRTFGELVEFAPEDPLARKRLGDLLMAHGWYDQAQRQYETLAGLTPDDPSVPLLMAAAAQGAGRLEEALGWLEKSAAGSSPDAASPVALAGRALGSAYLAWARTESASAGKNDELERLRARAIRIATGEQNSNLRVILSWSHPELRVALWTNALGSLMPAADNLPLLGVAQASVPITPAPLIALRLDPEDAALAARMGLQATLTLIRSEGSADELIIRRDVSFKSEQGKPLASVAFNFENNDLVPVVVEDER
ncbi:MAG TPA: VIT domain-containing protein [Polyangiaceae bacterium]|nr:VIT domain-containing protein [Polyangiaceae bacterium]